MTVGTPSHRQVGKVAEAHHSMMPKVTLDVPIAAPADHAGRTIALVETDLDMTAIMTTVSSTITRDPADDLFLCPRALVGT
jgi:hypothetical protein